MESADSGGKGYNKIDEITTRPLPNPPPAKTPVFSATKAEKLVDEPMGSSPHSSAFSLENTGVLRMKEGFGRGLVIKTAEDMHGLGVAIGQHIRGGECIELIGDVGAGKTTLVKGIAAGMAIDEDVQSPSFTLSRIYQALDGRELHHYDFYRLDSPGLLSYGLDESLHEPQAVTIIEWGQTVQDILPADRLRLHIRYRPADDSRMVEVHAPAEYGYLFSRGDT